jgi:hypothetical protein
MVKHTTKLSKFANPRCVRLQQMDQLTLQAEHQVECVITFPQNPSSDISHADKSSHTLCKIIFHFMLQRCLGVSEMR